MVHSQICLWPSTSAIVGVGFCFIIVRIIPQSHPCFLMYFAIDLCAPFTWSSLIFFATHITTSWTAASAKTSSTFQSVTASRSDCSLNRIQRQLYNEGMYHICLFLFCRKVKCLDVRCQSSQWCDQFMGTAILNWVEKFPSANWKTPLLCQEQDRIFQHHFCKSFWRDLVSLERFQWHFQVINHRSIFFVRKSHFKSFSFCIHHQSISSH
jgi:hypothetical protein